MNELLYALRCEIVNFILVHMYNRENMVGGTHQKEKSSTG
jgi:hypothetical protein